MSSTTAPDAPRPRRRLFWKYVVVIVALVTMVLAASAGVELWFTYRENQDALVALQREKAGAAATRIEAFIREIEHQMGWTTQPLLVSGPAALEQRRIDFLRLLRQVPAITELSYLDKEGKEQLRVSRLAMDVTGSANDLSADARFTQAIARRVYHGPVYFRKESEPYMVLAMAQSGGGVTVAEVNLKFIWDVVTQIKIGKAGRAYVADESGNLIAHPDISLVLQKTSLATLPQVREAISGQGDGSPLARDVQGRRVLTAHATIPGLRWVVFAEQPLGEALEPLQASIKRSLVLLVVGIALAMAASLVLARRMVRPIQALQVGAARIGGGELGHRLEIRSGDELETLAGEFNRMTAHLEESYATLELRVEDRTRELSESLEQQTATGDILSVISSSPTDVQPVFEAIVASCKRLLGARSAVVLRVVEGELRLAAFTTTTPAADEELQRFYPRPVEGNSVVSIVARERVPVVVTDTETDDRLPPARPRAQTWLALEHRCPHAAGRARRLARSTCRGRLPGRSRTRRSRSSDVRRSGRHRDRERAAVHGAARRATAISPSRSSSRRRRPRSCASSAARPRTSSPCSRSWRRMPRGCAGPATPSSVRWTAT